MRVCDRDDGTHINSDGEAVVSHGHRKCGAALRMDMLARLIIRRGASFRMILCCGNVARGGVELFMGRTMAVIVMMPMTMNAMRPMLMNVECVENRRITIHRAGGKSDSDDDGAQNAANGWTHPHSRAND
jgi:hypothetical protein